MKLDIDKTFDPRECPSCGCEVPRNNNRCPICSYEFPTPTRTQANLRLGGALLMLAVLALLLTRC